MPWRAGSRYDGGHAGMGAGPERECYHRRMSAKLIADFLKACPVFAGLPAEEIVALSAAAREERYPARAYIFSEGDAPAWFWLVRSGRIKILRQSPGGADVVLEILGPGEPFGGVAALQGRAYPATAQALELSTVVRIAPEPIVAMVQHHPALVPEMMRVLGRRLRAAHDSVKSLASDPVEARLAARLLRLAEEEGARDPRGLVLPFRLTRRTLAEMSGTTVETTIRIVRRWLAKGIVSEEDDQMIVPSLETLRAIAEAD